MNVETLLNGSQLVTMANGQEGTIIHLPCSNQCTVKFDGKDDIVSSPIEALAWMKKFDRMIRSDLKGELNESSS
ncbi:hypothetical protein [Shouchella miscanthi]|uniref:hypothetical protein n=1 Tax=Shouchella miscanthi TaxID=2598861 RepID=UPI00119FC8FA|nr:hypothetical protein [Shouchella miscanthi]